VLDTLSVAVGSGGVGVALAQSLSAWLRTRRSDVKLTFTVEGKTIEIVAHQVADPTELIARALEHHDEAGS
jgi:transcription antitermination factor NusA-like protein